MVQLIFGTFWAPYPSKQNLRNITLALKKWQKCSFVINIYFWSQTWGLFHNHGIKYKCSYFFSSIWFYLWITFTSFKRCYHGHAFCVISLLHILFNQEWALRWQKKKVIFFIVILQEPRRDKPTGSRKGFFITFLCHKAVSLMCECRWSDCNI